jgi:hypothetical protein
MSQGIIGRGQGFIADQTQLLQIAVDGLQAYNMTADAIISDFSEEIIREQVRVSQAPIQFNRHGDGATPDAQRQSYRLLSFPLQAYDAGAPFTVLGLQDSLPSDIQATMDGLMAGDAERMEMEFFRAIFTPQTVGSVGTAYQAGFYNGETDVPSYKNTAFSSAHFHYLGINTATLALSHIQDAIQDVREHGYGLRANSLIAMFNTAQLKTVENLLNITVSSSMNSPSRVTAQESGGYGTGLMFAGCEIIFNDNVPSGYFAVIDRSIRPLGRRVHVDPQYRGLQMYRETYDQNYPLAGTKFLHRYGFSVRHLGAGTCRQIVASTSFTTPTFRLAA